MPTDNFYNEILIDHNIHPIHKYQLENPNLVLEGVNPSCGDDIVVQLRVEDDIIVDGSFVGDGCAISQASADIMLELIIGQHKDKALELADAFMRMIKNEASEEDMDLLDEAGALQDISHMPARVKCAVLGWHTMEELFGRKSE